MFGNAFKTLITVGSVAFTLCGCKIWTYAYMVRPKAEVPVRVLNGRYSIDSLTCKCEWPDSHYVEVEDGTDVIARIKPILLELQPKAFTSECGHSLRVTVVEYGERGLDVIVETDGMRESVGMELKVAEITVAPESVDEHIVCRRLTTWWGPGVLDLGCTCAKILDQRPVWDLAVANGVIMCLQKSESVSAGLTF